MPVNKNTTEKYTMQEELNKITTLRAKANLLKVEIEQLTLKAKNKEVERKETLEELESILKEYKNNTLI